MSGKRKDGITSLAKLRQRCSRRDLLDPECCWIWRGAERGGKAVVWLVIDGKGQAVSGPRAAAVLSGKTIPPGGRAWATCKDPLCCNPRHAVAGTFAEWGAWIRQAQLWVGNQKNIAAARARGRERSKINLKIARDIRRSTLPPLAETRRVREVHGVDVSRTLVDNVRQMKRWAEPNPFAGLGARNA